MHRFYVPPEQCRHSRVTLPDREAHHALHVLRVRRGDVVTVLDGAGGEYVCETAELDRSSVQLTIHETRTVAPPVCQVTLLQAIPKGKTFDSIIQKATELGVHR